MKWLSKWIQWVREGKWIQWIDYHGKWIVGILLLFSTGLWMAALDGSIPSRFLHGFYYSLQFIVLNKTADNVQHKMFRHLLYLTQLAIPLFAYITIFSKLFHDRIVPYMKKLEVSLLENHHVIVGYGAFGQALGKELIDNGKSVVGIDLIDPPVNKEGESKSNKTEPVLLSYNALYSSIENIANLKSAEALYLLLPKERENLSILQTITEKHQHKSQVFIRSESSAMQRLLTDWVGIKAFNADTALDIRSCNPIEIAARGIVNEYAPDLYISTQTGSIAQVVMVTGTSEAAKAIVLRFARIGIYVPKGKLHLMWAGDGVTNAFSELKAIYPALETDYFCREQWGGGQETSREYFESVLPTIQITTLNLPATQAIRNNAVSQLVGAQWPSVIYLCHDSDVHNLAEARDLQAALCVQEDLINKIDAQKRRRLILAVQSKSVLGIRDKTDIPVLGILPYCIEEVSLDAMFAKTIAKDRADNLAISFHSVFSGPEKKAWKQEKLFIKESNRDVADHLAIKVRYAILGAGIDAERVTKYVLNGKTKISDEERSRIKNLMMEKKKELVTMENRRYRAFMFMSGFSHGSRPETSHHKQFTEGKELERTLRVNPTLLQAELPQSEQDKDNKIVVQSLKALDLSLENESAIVNKKYRQ